jgi:hypothetical protein
MLGLRVLRRTAWMAVVAVLLNALAPWVFHAQASARDGTWLELCTADGIEHIRVADGQVTKKGTPVTDVAAVHCPYCIPHGASFGLVPPSPLSVPAIAGPHAGAASVDWISLSLLLWAANQARAPPLAY